MTRVTVAARVRLGPERAERLAGDPRFQHLREPEPPSTLLDWITDALGAVAVFGTLIGGLWIAAGMGL